MKIALTEPVPAPASDEVLGRELRLVVDEELSRLAPRYQRPILLCYLQGKTTEEAGRILGCPKGTVLSRLARAREKLRSRLLRRGLALSAGALAMLLTEKSLTAAMTTGLVHATTQVAVAVALGQAAGAGVVSAPVAALTKGVLMSMMLTRLKMVAIIVLLLAGTLAGAWVWQAPAQAPTQAPAQGPAPVRVAAAPQGDDAADLRALIDRGIKAAGGPKKLNNFRAGSAKLKGKIFDGDREEPFTMTGHLQGSDQAKIEGEASHQGMPQAVTFALNGDKSWGKFGERVEDGPADAARNLKDFIRVFRYAHALTPLKDQNVRLAPLGESDVEGKRAVGLKVSCKDQEDIDLVLDKETGLPLKAEFQLSKENEPKKKLEFLFSDYREFAGRKHFTKVVVKEEGRPLCEVELSDFRWVESLEASIFARP